MKSTDPLLITILTDIIIIITPTTFLISLHFWSTSTLSFYIISAHCCFSVLQSSLSYHFISFGLLVIFLKKNQLLFYYQSLKLCVCYSLRCCDRKWTHDLDPSSFRQHSGINDFFLLLLFWITNDLLVCVSYKRQSCGDLVRLKYESKCQVSMAGIKTKPWGSKTDRRADGHMDIRTGRQTDRQVSQHSDQESCWIPTYNVNRINATEFYSQHEVYT